MTSLIDRIEAGWDRRDVMSSAFRAAYPTPDLNSPIRQAWEAISRRYHRLLNAEAYLDAATMLIPEGAMYRSGHDGSGPDPSRYFCEVITDAPDCQVYRAVEDSESKARAAAALRARGVA